MFYCCSNLSCFSNYIEWFLLFYWVKTLQYSLKIIKEYVEKHDVIMFEKYVATDKLCGQIVESILNQRFSNEGENNPITQNIIKAVKPTITSVLKDNLIDFVRSGNLDEKTLLKQNREDELLDDEEFTLDSIFNMKYKDISDVEISGDRAKVSLIMYSNKFEKDLTIVLGMGRVDDGIWQIDSIENIQDFIDEYAKIKQKRLTQINQPIADELAQ